MSTDESQQSVTTVAPRNDNWVDPNPPADLTPWAAIGQYAASQNSGNYCSPTLTVTLPSNIRTYGGRTYTVNNPNYNRPYCVAVDTWERTKDYYTDAERPPRPDPSSY